MIQKINIQRHLLDTDELEIKQSENTLENSYDVILHNEDYTVGNILNYELYESFYKKHEILSYVGFKKMHPHDSDSILRVAFKDSSGKSGVKDMLTAVIVDAIKKISDVKACFDKRK